MQNINIVWLVRKEWNWKWLLSPLAPPPIRKNTYICSNVSGVMVIDNLLITSRPWGRGRVTIAPPLWTPMDMYIILYTFIHFYKILFFLQSIILNSFVYQIVQSSKMVFYFVQSCTLVYTLKYTILHAIVNQFVHEGPICISFCTLSSIFTKYCFSLVIMNSFVYQILLSSKIMIYFVQFCISVYTLKGLPHN